MLLAQREHSRAELKRKLLPMALGELRARAGADADAAALRAPAAEQVDALLDILEA
jgi:hypothetical protein